MEIETPTIEIELPGGTRGLQGVPGPKGEPGKTGPKGDTGPANTLTIGSVISGTTPSASITGEVPNQILNLVLPKGDAGEQGTQGVPGIKGDPGYSIVKVEKKAGTGLPGTTDTYGCYLNDQASTEVGEFSVYNGSDGQGSGDMLRNIYDVNNNGIVDNAERVNDHTVETDVPNGAKFTDTTNYNDFQNLPSINNVQLLGNKTLDDLNIQPRGNYLTDESDPTVPNHVKSITQENITNWNNKSDFSGSYNDLTDKPTTLESVGDISQLQTSDKSNTVNAINEVVGRIEEEETNLKTLFKFKTLSVPIDIAGNATASFQVGWLDEPEGYTYLGVISKESGYGDQWQITYSLYQGNKIFAVVRNNYSQTLSNTITCTVIYIKSDYLSTAIVGDENGTE